LPPPLFLSRLSILRGLGVDKEDVDVVITLDGVDADERNSANEGDKEEEEERFGAVVCTTGVDVDDDVVDDSEVRSRGGTCWMVTPLLSAPAPLDCCC